MHIDQGSLAKHCHPSKMPSCCQLVPQWSFSWENRVGEELVANRRVFYFILNNAYFNVILLNASQLKLIWKMDFVFFKHKFGLILYFTNTRLAPILYFTNTRLVKQILPLSQRNQRTDWITICILSNLVFGKYKIASILYLPNTRLMQSCIYQIQDWIHFLPYTIYPVFVSLSFTFTIVLSWTWMCIFFFILFKICRKFWINYIFAP